MTSLAKFYTVIADYRGQERCQEYGNETEARSAFDSFVRRGAFSVVLQSYGDNLADAPIILDSFEQDAS